MIPVDEKGLTSRVVADSREVCSEFPADRPVFRRAHLGGVAVEYD